MKSDKKDLLLKEEKFDVEIEFNADGKPFEDLMIELFKITVLKKAIKLEPKR